MEFIDEDEMAYAMHESYLQAQQLNLEKIQLQRAEEKQFQRALTESQVSHDALVAKKLHRQETEHAQKKHEQQWEYYDGVIQQQSQEIRQGGWDCPRCSFQNLPYTASRCHACEVAAPPHALCFTRIPDSKFGVELELVIERGARDGFDYQALAENLTTALIASADSVEYDSTLQVKFCGYTHDTTDYWKIVTDSSIKTTNADDLAMELVSPVLQGERGLEQMRYMLQALRMLGIATNTTCGFHVHLDASSISLDSLKRIAQCFCALEDAFDLLVARSWESLSSRHRSANQNRYCQSNRLAFGEMSNLQRWQKIDEARTISYLVNRLVNPGRDRYRKLNLTNITNDNRPSTIEFRNHGCVEELLEAEAWVRLLVHFCTHAAQQNAASANCLLPQSAGVRLQLDCLFDLVACPGLEQYFCLERRLFDRHEALTNEWKCQTCQRAFKTSRSLAQHCAARH